MTMEEQKNPQEELETMVETAENVQEENHDSKELDIEISDAEKLLQAEEQIAALKDQYLRQVAEFDNFRKRTIKEKTELILNGGEKVLSSLLPVLDDLERAQATIQKSDDLEGLKEGVELIVSKLFKTLEQQGLKKIDTDSKEFDTDFHEAIALVPTETEEQKNKIIDCVQTGYMLNERVIRHAKVVVGQ